MAICISFVRSRQCTAAWARCVRRARAGDVLCNAHRDAINGVTMGILHHSEPYHVTKQQIEEAKLEAGTGQIAFESAIARLNVPTGDSIRPGRKALRRIRERRKQKSAARRARNAGRTRGEEAAAASSVEEACADRGGAA